MKIVLAGSRKLAFIPEPVIALLKDHMEAGDTFFIGCATRSHWMDDGKKWIGTRKIFCRAC